MRTVHWNGQPTRRALLVTALTSSFSVLLSGPLVSARLPSRRKAMSQTPEAADAQTANLFPIVEVGSDGSDVLWGFIDSTGTMVTPPQFDDISDDLLYFGFSVGNLAPVQVASRWGFVDETGQLAIEPQFEEPPGRFSEGLVPVQISGRWGFVDKSGVFVINPRFDNALPFSEGMAVVRLGDLWGVIDQTGEVIIEPQFEDVGYESGYTLFEEGQFSEGLLLVKAGENVGYIDQTGEMVIPLGGVTSAYQAGNFSEGLAAVWIDGDWGFIDRTGKFVIEPRFPDEGFYREQLFSEGLAGIAGGYIDTTGNWVIEPQFAVVSPFSGGLATIGIGTEYDNLRYGYIDQTGEIVINPAFTTAFPFIGKLAWVRLESSDDSNLTVGWIDRSGNYVWQLTR